MKLCGGHLQVNGRLALVTQQAWIYNSTFRENILMGQPYDEERYQMVLESCSLLSDIRQLVNGDLTEIGERGVNLRFVGMLMLCVFLWVCLLFICTAMLVIMCVCICMLVIVYILASYGC